MRSCSLEVVVWAGGSRNWGPGTQRKQGTLCRTGEGGEGEGLRVADLHLVDCYLPLWGTNRHHKLRCTCNRTCFISPRLHLISIRHFHSAEIKEIVLLASWASSPTLRETGLRAKLVFVGPPGRDPSWDIQVLAAEVLTSQILCPSVG